MANKCLQLGKRFAAAHSSKKVLSNGNMRIDRDNTEATRSTNLPWKPSSQVSVLTKSKQPLVSQTHKKHVASPIPPSNHQTSPPVTTVRLSLQSCGHRSACISFLLSTPADMPSHKQFPTNPVRWIGIPDSYTQAVHPG